MIMILMMALTMMAGLFAYEPKKECAKVKGNKVYYEETYMNRIFKETRMWTYKIKSDEFIYLRSGTFDGMWRELLANRERYDLNLEVASYKDEKCSTCDFLERYKSDYENNKLNETEMKQYESMLKLHQATNNIKESIEGKPTHAKTATKSYYELVANEQKMKSVNRMPFVTEENWKTITREELLDKIYAFVEEAEANNQ